MWWTMKSTPRLSIQLRAGDTVVGREIVAHHLDPEVPSGVDDAPDGRLVRAPHDDDEVRAGLGHHLGLEIAAVHRLQVGDDRMLGKPRAQCLDRPQAVRRGAAACRPPASPRPRSTPTAAVSSASSSDDQVEGELDDGVGEIHEENILTPQKDQALTLPPRC